MKQKHLWQSYLRKRPYDWYLFWSFTDFFSFLWDHQRRESCLRVCETVRSWVAVCRVWDCAFEIWVFLFCGRGCCTCLIVFNSASFSCRARPSPCSWGGQCSPPRPLPTWEEALWGTGRRYGSTACVNWISSCRKDYAPHVVDLFLVDEGHAQVCLSCLEVFHKS